MSPIGGGRKTGGIGGPAKKGPIGSVGTFTGDSLTKGTKAARWSRSQYPTTTTTSTTSTTTTTAP